MWGKGVLKLDFRGRKRVGGCLLLVGEEGARDHPGGVDGLGLVLALIQLDVICELVM